MAARHKLLLLDDDPDMVEIYREILQRLPGQPEIQTACSGARAIAMLESESFDLFVTDLSMPKMDGFQVLAVVRRRWPHMRTAVMTSVQDDQFRRRAYGMGVDLFCDKPSTSKEIEVFLSSVDALLHKDQKGGEAPAKARSLGELLHLECLARNSSVVRCTLGTEQGRVWIQNGEIIDATTGEANGEEALQKLLHWQGAKCELMPAEPTRPRHIFNAQPDFAAAKGPARSEPILRPVPRPSEPAVSLLQSPLPEARPAVAQTVSRLAELARTEGVELMLTVRGTEPDLRVDSWGVEHPEEMAQWVCKTLQRFRALGEVLQTGKPSQVDALASTARFALVSKGETDLCVGFRRALAPEQARETLKLILSQWAS